MLSQQALHEIASVQSQEASSQHALLTALRCMQAERLHVGPQEVEFLAGLLDLSPATVEGVARFYDQITKEPVGRHVLTLCRGISCYLCGADAVAEETEQILDVPAGGTTSDGRLTLRLAECIGDCSHAPAALLDDEFVGPFDPQSLHAMKDL
ncbi:MAG: NAD(P)H-dependent oxidoreductase subunit E [Thermaerobacter sp.]|nr:NAD(P)H-dependent oxidoreductase subunit E [Thermaerobacter sp.]